MLIAHPAKSGAVVNTLAISTGYIPNLSNYDGENELHDLIFPILLLSLFLFHQSRRRSMIFK